MYFLTAERGSIHHSLRRAFNRFSEEHPLIWLANKRNERPEWGVTLLFWAEVPDDVAKENYRIEQGCAAACSKNNRRMMKPQCGRLNISIRKIVTKPQKATRWQQWQQWIEGLFR